MAGTAFSAATTSHPVTIVVNQIAALTMNSGGNITLAISDGGGTLVGGSTPSAATDDTQYLQYTLVNTGAVPLRKIQVSASAGAPLGTTLTVTATGVSGAAGTPQIPAVVGAGALDLIRDVGSCATGSAATNGARLTYLFSISSIGTVAVGNTALSVVYTILDQ